MIDLDYTSKDSDPMVPEDEVDEINYIKSIEVKYNEPEEPVEKTYLLD